MRLTLHTSPLLVLLFPLVVSAAEPVGPLADPLTWTISGAHSFSAEEIREALFDDLAIIALLSPGAERRQLLTTVEQRTALGYASHGFAACQVHARVTDGHLTLTITEGPLDRCGDITVLGATAVPAADLRAVLTTNWVAGTPVNYHDEMRAWYARRAEQVYRDQHHPWVAIEATYVSGASGTDLCLTVRDEGPEVHVGAITINGCQRFSDDAVRALIPLHPGDLLPGNATALIVEALRASGRFRAQQAVVAKAADPTLADLDVTVMEGLNTPAPDVPLTVIQAAAVRTATWLAEHGRHGPEALELAWTTPTYAIKVVMAGDTGLACSLRLIDANPSAPASIDGNVDDSGPAWGTLLLRGADDQRLITSHSGGCLRLPSLAWILTLTIEGLETLEPRGQSSGSAPRETTLRFYLEHSSNTAGKPPLAVTMAIAPFVALALIAKPGTTVTINAGILTVDTSTGLHLTADADSGRLLGLKVVSSELHVTLRVAEPTALAAVATRLDGQPKRPADAHPWTTSLQILIAETSVAMIHRLPVDAPLRDWMVVAKVLTPWVCEHLLVPSELSMLQAKKKAVDQPDAQAFSIPALPQPAQDQMTGLVSYTSKVLSRRLSEVYAAGQWPVALPRSVFLLINGRGEAGLAELEALARDPASGPLACLGAAEVLAYIHHPDARAVGQRGLAQLDDAGFAKDLALLLGGGTSGRPTSLNTLLSVALAELPPDAPWLAELTPSGRALFSLMVAAAHAPGTAETRTKTLTTLLWHGWLRDWAKQQLTAIAQPEPP